MPILLFSFLALMFLGGALLIAVDGLRDNLCTSDVGVVLGNAVDADGLPAPRLRSRLDRAIELFDSKLFPYIIVSGAVGKEGFDEGKVMADYLSTHGVPKEAILIDSMGVTTFATARNTQEILQQRSWKSVLIISQYFHISRTRLAMNRAGIGQVCSAHAYRFDLRDLYSLPRETLGYLWYMVRPF